VRPALATAAAAAANSSTSTAACPPAYQRCIDAPTLNGLLLVRVEVKNASDVAYVDSYIDALHVAGANAHAAVAAPLVPADLQGLPAAPAERALTLTARLASRNPPAMPALAAHLPAVLALAGVNTTGDGGNGSYATPAGVNMTAAQAAVNASLAAFYGDASNNVPLSNGWSVLSPRFSGGFERGGNVVARAFVAAFGYLQNTAEQAIYPTPARQTYALAAGRAYAVRFVGGRPPLPSDGFWSLTAYDAQGYLVANAQEVYAVGDRSGLRYPDGELVYGAGGAAAARDDAFEVLVQATDAAPPANWTSNWLPAPAGGTGFQLTLRIYAPTAAFEDGAWTYPVIEERAAVV